jgi:hypothetical protein
MKTPSTIQALEGAIEMLQAILTGSRYNAAEFVDRLKSYEAARDAHHIADMQIERARKQLQELARQRREVGS